MVTLFDPDRSLRMRRTVLALLAATALVAGCGQPATDEAPAAEAGATPAAVLPPPEMPADAPPQEEVDPAAGVAPAPSEADARSCRESAGEAASARLVERCRQVSPATHPPCNAVNPCRMIEDEIARACDMYGAGETRPAECAA